MRTWRFDIILLTLLLVGASGVAWHADRYPIGNWVDQQLYDLMLPWQEETPDPRVVVVEIDDKSLQKHGRWPWPRDLIVELIDKSLKLHPAVVGLDILFPEPSDGETDDDLRRLLARQDVISGVTFGHPTAKPFEYEGVAWPMFKTKIGLAGSLISEDLRLGHLTPQFDSDGSIRRLQPVVCHNTACVNMFSLAILENLLLTEAHVKQTPALFSANQLCIANYCQQLTAEGSMLVPYHRNYRYQRLSADEILSNNTTIDISGSIMLLGSSAVGLGDHVKTPLAPLTPGVDIHAHLVSAWLDNQQWAAPVQQSLWMIPAMLAWFCFAIRWAVLSDAKKILLISSGVLATIVLFFLPRFGLWVSPSAFLLLFGLGSLLLIINDAVATILGRRELYRAFASYVPPVVLRELIESEKHESALQSRRVEATVMFADIADFTAISEKLRPEQLTEMTNYIFTELTKDIHHFQGTLDKYMGDAVMAFWGAPAEQPDHTFMAWRCAIALQQRINGMDSWLEEKGYPCIKLNIGIETGPVVVGDMGSVQRRAYTVMGYTVNVAAHIQRVCKQHRQSILVGPQMASILPEDQTLLIKEVNVKGISKPLTLAAPSPKVFDAYIH